jgi:hypothetical protein
MDEMEELQQRIAAGLDRLEEKMDKLEEQKDKAEDKLREIRNWCDAYPLQVFPEPDLALAKRLLKTGGITLDAVSASSMRHVLVGIKKIIDGTEA